MFLNERAQEEAPFELLIAVILMTFVIAIGLYTMTEASFQKCINMKENKLVELSGAIVAAANGGTSSVSFFSDKCSEEEKVYLRRFDEPMKCNVCMGSPDKCTMLIYTSKDNRGYMEKCVQIPWDTVFDYFGPEKCPEKLNDYGGTDLTPNYETTSAYTHSEQQTITNPIEDGSYKMYYRITTETYPVVCVYKR